MSEFPGLDKWYLREDAVMDCKDVRMWQMVPGPKERVASPATLRVAMWTGRVVTLENIDRSVSVRDVLERLQDMEKDLSATPLERTRLAVDERVVADWRSVLTCFDGPPEGDGKGADTGKALTHLVDDDGALRCALIIEPCPKVALGVSRLAPFVEAAVKESKEDKVHIMEMAKARVRFAIPPKRKNAVPNHFKQDTRDAEPWGSIMRFENFMKARAVHKGNHAKLRPLRSGRWKATFPGLVPVSHRWHDKESLDLPGSLSDDPSTIPAIYRPFTNASRNKPREKRHRNADSPKDKAWRASTVSYVDSDDSDTEVVPRKAGAFHGLKSFERVQTPEIMHHKTHEIKAPTSKQVFKQGEGFVKVKLKKEEQDAERQRLVALAHLENPDMGRISRF